jgi:hypothetical protein
MVERLNLDLALTDDQKKGKEKISVVFSPLLAEDPNGRNGVPPSAPRTAFPCSKGQRHPGTEDFLKS